MKAALGSLRSVLKIGAFSVLGCMTLVACHRKGNTPQELPSGRFIQPEIPTTPAQTRSLSEEIEQELATAFQPLFSDLLTQQNSKEVASFGVNRFAGELAKSFASNMTQRLAQSGATHCIPAPEKTNTYLSCLVFEMIEDNFMNERDAQKWIASLAHVGKNSAKAAASDNEIFELSQSTPALLVKVFSNASLVENILNKLTKNIDGVIRAVEIMSQQQASMDLPYLADSFVNGRTYVMTTSLQQASVGTSRVFNLESNIVKFQINSKRLVILRPGEGLYAGSSQEDIIVAAYPIVRTVQPEGSDETFYQVDFSHPENKSFLVPSLGDGDPALQMTADVVVPRIAHAAKPVVGRMTNGLYFTGKDNSLVVDQLVLLNTNKFALGSDDEAGSSDAQKDAIRPTVHVVQGFFPVSLGNDSFAEKQALPLDFSQNELRARGVNDRTEGKDVPYFSTAAIFESRGGRARLPTQFIRKFNVEKEITFVISRNVPASMVPVLKSAVHSYRDLFVNLTPPNLTPARVVAYTQDEFEEANRTQGLALGGGVIAADPRVNMIYWDDSFSIGSAWATTVTNPNTGEIISGDVMLTGSMWAMEGCKGYFARTWQKDKEPNLPKRPSGTVPSPISRFLWDAKCEAALANLGIFSKPNTPKVDDASKKELAAFDEANRKGDLVSLASFASRQLGRQVSPNEMVSSLDNPVSAPANAASTGELAVELRKELNSGAAFKDAAAARTERLQSMLNSSANDETNQLLRKMKNGSNQFTSRLDCVKQFMPNADVALAESGAPAITSPFVNSPETGAMALVRSVVVHELGHIFGLRHNFIASTTPAVLADEAKLPLAVTSGTDSVMDYNDYGIEMDWGAMRDFTSPEGAVGLGTFGIYDVLALATSYHLPTDGVKFKTKTAFCTDSNVSLLGNCQRFDFGKDNNEYTLHHANLALQRLRYANPMDAVLDPRSPRVYAQLIRSYSQDMLKLSGLWGLAQSSAHDSTAFPERKAYIQLAELGFRGAGASQEFLKKFSQQYGVEPLGVINSLTLQSSFFQSPEYGSLMSGLIRKEIALNLIAVSRVLQNKARNSGSDAAYTGVIHDIRLGEQNYEYLNELIHQFGDQIVIPVGGEAAFEFLEDGQRKDASQATLDGKPLKYLVEKPLFNHQAQVVALPNFSIDGPAPGSRRSVTLIVKGRNTIEDMVQAVAALAVLAGDNPEHPAFVRLADNATALRQMLQPEPCGAASVGNSAVTTDVSTSAECEALARSARAPAAIILNAILSAAQGALPTTMVASGVEGF